MQRTRYETWQLHRKGRRSLSYCIEKLEHRGGVQGVSLAFKFLILDCVRWESGRVGRSLVRVRFLRIFFKAFVVAFFDGFAG